MSLNMRREVRRLVRRLFSGFARLAARLSPPKSPWERVSVRVPAIAFGPGSRRHFGHYLEGESAVRAQSIDDIVTWLLEFEYASDTDQFNERDRWQHPTDFEQRRRGDCEDFALWAWRKLAEIGVDAEFYMGRVPRREAGEVDRQHAWVVYRENGAHFLFEPAARSRQQMIRRLPEAMDDYVPHFAVNHRIHTCAFGGYVLDARLLGRRPREPQAPVHREITMWRG